MTPAERQALLFLAAVGALGAGTRLVARGDALHRPPDAAERAALQAQLAAVDSARAADAAARAGRRAGRGARRRGGGTESDGLTGGRPGAPGAPGAAGARRGRRTPTPQADTSRWPAAVAARPGWDGATWSEGASSGRRRGGATSRRDRAVGPTALAGPPLDLDRADAAALEALPGIGPALARRIVAARAQGGPFGSLAALDARVAGVGPALARRLAPHVTFSSAPRPSDAGAPWPPP